MRTPMCVRGAARLRATHSFAEEGAIPPGTASCDLSGLPREKRLAFSVPLKQARIATPCGRPRGPVRINVARFFSPILDPLCFAGEPKLNS